MCRWSVARPRPLANSIPLRPRHECSQWIWRHGGGLSGRAGPGGGLGQARHLVQGWRKPPSRSSAAGAIGTRDRLSRHRYRGNARADYPSLSRIREAIWQERPVAVRSSATAEDLPNASFAGQHDSYINMRGEEAVFEACRRCFASIFTDRAIVYRNDNGFDHFKVALSVAVMKMVRSDMGASGVIFTLDTESGFRDVVLVTGSYGLGENIVQGRVDPDEFYVHKPTYRAGHRAVLRHTLGEKQVKMMFARRSRPRPREPQRARAERARFVSRRGGSVAGGNALRIEDHYSLPRAAPRRWISNGPRMAFTANCLSSRPGPRRWPRTRVERGSDLCPEEKGEIWFPAAPSARRSQAASRIVPAKTTWDFQPGEILVADTTTPDWEPVMKKAAGISPTAAAAPAMPRSSRASWAFRQWSEPGTPGKNWRPAQRSRFPAPRAISARSMRACLPSIYRR